MSKTTLYKSLFCAALILALNIAPALALPAAGKAPAPRQQAVDQQQDAQPEMSDAAKIAFVRSLSARNAKPGTSSRKPVNQKMMPVSCEESWFFGWTKCCSESLCCTWYGDGNGPRCI